MTGMENGSFEVGVTDPRAASPGVSMIAETLRNSPVGGVFPRRKFWKCVCQ